MYVIIIYINKRSPFERCKGGITLEILKKAILPPGRIGVVGGGQLGRMLAYEAKRMGYYVIVLDPTENSPAGQVSDEQIVASLHDGEAIEKLAKMTDVLTYEFEFVNAKVLCSLKEKGYKVYPSGETLKKIQNKYIQKSFLKEAGLPVPKFEKVSEINDIKIAVEKYGYPLVIKNCTGGYDGKGNIIIQDENELEEILNSQAIKEWDMMVEEFIPFDREVSITLARGVNGEIKHYEVVLNTHKESILRTTIAPANITKEIDEKIKNISGKILELFDDIGLFCVELFLTKENEIYINEVAPRPHNSAHYTIEACVTSQYEQQLRAICGLPLGSTKLNCKAVMVNVLGEEKITNGYVINGLENLLALENVYFHYYGKSYVDVKKKVGHITALGESVSEALEKAENALEYIKINKID